MTNMTDDYVALGWAAPATCPTTAHRALVVRADDLERQRDEAVSRADDRSREIAAQAAVIAELAQRNVRLGEELDAALGTAVREKAAHIRLDGENRGLRERVGVLQRANERRRPVRRLPWVRDR